MFLKSKSALAYLQQEAGKYAKKASEEKRGLENRKPLTALGSQGLHVEFEQQSNLLFQRSTFAIPQNTLERCRGRAERHFWKLTGGFLQLVVVFK